MARLSEVSVGALVQSLLPVFGMILLGYPLRRFRFPGDRFWPLITGQTLLAAVTLPAVVAWSARWI